MKKAKSLNDKQIFDLIKKESKRQIEGIELIPSENYVSEEVLKAMGSILTNKYSEGYPHKRYYNGNEFIDGIEDLAIERAKKLFKAEHVNVQPYSGSPANMAVYFAFLKPGDKVMGMALSAGGHLTHGFKVSITGSYYDSLQYGVGKDGYIDYDEVLKLAKKHKPKLLWSGATAYSRKINYKKFREIADKVGAILVADIAHISGLVVAGVHPNPFPYADVVTTTTHKTLRGPRGAMIMCKKEFAEAIDKSVFPGLQGGPHNHTTAGIAVALKEAGTIKFVNYARQIVKNAQKLSAELTKRGYKIVSGGTDNHLMLIDLTNIDKMTGKIASDALEEAGITVNKNTIPDDPRKPWDPSGVRLGTPAITTRGLKEKDMIFVAKMIDEAIKNHSSKPELKKLKNEVKKYMKKFPIPGISK